MRRGVSGRSLALGIFVWTFYPWTPSALFLGTGAAVGTVAGSLGDGSHRGTLRWVGDVRTGLRGGRVIFGCVCVSFSSSCPSYY